MASSKQGYRWYSSYEKLVPHSIDVNEYSSIVDLLERSFKKFTHRPAFTCMGRTLTYGDIDRLSAQFASYLQHDLKLKKGDRVALMMPNVLQYPVALFGVLRAGMIAVNCNPLYTPRELSHQLKDSGAKAIVIVANFAHTLQKCLKDAPIEHVVVTELGDLLGFPKSLLVNAIVKHVKKMVPAFALPGARFFAQALMAGSKNTFTRPTLGHQDIAFLQYTGGTTGVSKGAVLSHGNMVANMLQARAWISSSALKEGEEIIITALPLYHIFSLTANCFVFNSIGALNVLIPNPRDFDGFIKELKKFKFTAFTGINTLFNALCNHPEFKSVDFSRLKLTLGGGMAVQRPVAEKWKAVTGVPLIEAYGLTETSPAACINPLSLSEYNGYVGLPIPSTVVEIRNEDGKEVDIGQVGEVCIGGPQVMQGYWERPEETSKVIGADRFLKTGDMGYMTEQGYVKLVDRKKEMILVSGFNVYPSEIEEVAMLHPKVQEAAAIAVPDAKSGEAPKLFIVPKDPSLTAAEILAHCKENLTGYKMPKHVEFRQELPKSNVGKILRKDLK